MAELYLHSTLGRSLQSAVQQRSLLRWSSPGSHSSPSSTREFPHTLLFLSLKQMEALAFRLCNIDFLLQSENNYRGAPKHLQTDHVTLWTMTPSWIHINEGRTLLLEWSPLTAMGYITYLPPWSSLGTQPGILSGSWIAPKLWPSSWVVTKSASCWYIVRKLALLK